jgi:hypothetical protein
LASGGRGERAVSSSEERLAKNEIHFREVSERLNEIRRATMTDYLCECCATTCIETIELTNDEYKRARRRPTVFVLIPGHERIEVERVLENTERFVLVEKVVAVEEIVDSDPSSD